MSVLVAGIGNIFFGDDAFGVEVVRRLSERPLPHGVDVEDFGIRGFDLANTLMEGTHANVVLVDALPQGGRPGSLYLLEPGVEEAGDLSVEPHGMDPATVLRMIRALGGCPPRVLVVGCEPASVDFDPGGLSPPVAAAVDDAVQMVESLISDLST